MSYAYAIEKDSADNAYGIERSSGDIKVTMAADYSTGKYGLDESTDILYIPLEIKYRSLPWQFSATLPYIKIKGPGGLVGAGPDLDRTPFAGLEPGLRVLDDRVGGIAHPDAGITGAVILDCVVLDFR